MKRNMLEQARAQAHVASAVSKLRALGVEGPIRADLGRGVLEELADDPGWDANGSPAEPLEPDEAVRLEHLEPHDRMGAAWIAAAILVALGLIVVVVIGALIWRR